MIRRQSPSGQQGNAGAWPSVPATPRVGDYSFGGCADWEDWPFDDSPGLLMLCSEKMT